MNRCHKWTPALLCMGVLAMHSAASFAETRIGVAASTKPNADGFVGAGSQSLSAGSEVFANETVRTGNLGQADLVFLDQTNLTVGPTSEVLLDKFVYDPTGPKGKVVLQLSRGAFRFVTGTQDHRAYAVNTPYGSLGVRGTTVEVVVSEKKKPRPDECVTRVRLVEGAGASFTLANGQVAQLTNPNETICITKNGTVTHGSSSTSILGFQVAGETPPPSIGGIGGIPPPGTGPPTITPCVTHCQP
jgi:FecR protein